MEDVLRCKNLAGSSSLQRLLILLFLLTFVLVVVLAGEFFVLVRITDRMRNIVV
jgi:hypothetical protein